MGFHPNSLKGNPAVGLSSKDRNCKVCEGRIDRGEYYWRAPRKRAPMCTRCKAKEPQTVLVYKCGPAGRLHRMRNFQPRNSPDQG